MEAHSTQHHQDCPGCLAAAKEIASLKNRVAELEKLLDQSRRGGKRQAPFSKGPPKANPKPPGRKPGPDYGPKAFRSPPPPTQIDEVCEAPLPECCPHCSGAVQLEKVEHQYQTEIPRRPIHRQFNVQIGRCTGCQRRLQGRHPLQTSDALGCCASQLGPDVQAAIVFLNKQAGLSQGKISQLFSTLFGMQLSRGGACQAMLRGARKCLPQYHQIIRSIGQAPWVVPDETGWRVGGHGAWLHTAVTEQVVAFLVARERGFEATGRLVPPDYSGVMIHDAWSPYRRFHEASHQTCTAHLLRRCREMLEVARGGAVIFPRKVKALLQEGLELRDRRDAGRISLKTACRKADELQDQVVELARPIKTNAANERLAGHLFRQQRHLFTYLREAGIDATNYRAEQALRMPIINRKVWGGNRTENGAAAQGILASVLQTASKVLKGGKQALEWISALLRSPDLAPPLVPTLGP